MGLEGIAESGGRTLMDDANLARIASDEQAQSRGAREAIISGANARGVGGSGLELMAQLKNQQDSATRQSQRDLDVASMAEKRALEALIAAGQQSGQMQAQDFGQQSQIAQANDAISRFNAQNQQNQANLNTGVRNDASAANLAVAQDIANANTGTRNQQQQLNKGLIQQNFDNEIRKRGGQSQVAQTNAANEGINSANRANAQNQTIGMGLSMGSMFLGGGGGNKQQARKGNQVGEPYQQDGVMYANQGGIVPGTDEGTDTVPAMLRPGEMVVRKEDVPDMLVKAHTDDDGGFDAAAFLDSITGQKYGYSRKGK